MSKAKRASNYGYLAKILNNLSGAKGWCKNWRTKIDSKIKNNTTDVYKVSS